MDHNGALPRPRPRYQVEGLGSACGDQHLRTVAPVAARDGLVCLARGGVVPRRRDTFAYRFVQPGRSRQNADVDTQIEPALPDLFVAVVPLRVRARTIPRASLPSAPCRGR